MNLLKPFLKMSIKPYTLAALSDLMTKALVAEKYD